VKVKPQLTPMSTYAAVPCSETITEEDLNQCMDEIANSCQNWPVGDFVLVKRLQEARRNFGSVEHMKIKSSSAALARFAHSDEHFGLDSQDVHVAVKKMPRRWTLTSPKSFDQYHPQSVERPWQDLGLLKKLNDIRFPYVCDLLGLYVDSESTFVVTSLASRGDLFSWSFRTPGPGPDREACIQPVFAQLCHAVRWLHDMGVAHRDLSLENVCLAEDPKTGEAQIKLIDFAMATCSRPCHGKVGKRSYQSPEIHLAEAYDPFIADAFALGVILFVLAAQCYPWTATRSDKCDIFRYVDQHGLKEYFANRRIECVTGAESLTDIFSREFCFVLEGLIDLDPSARACLGEVCFSCEMPACFRRQSVWEMPWLGGQRVVR